MNVDREQQKKILELLFAEYPSGSAQAKNAILEMFKKEPARTSGNLLYLQRHGLIDHAISISYGLSFENANELNKQQLALYSEPIIGDSGYAIIDNRDGTITIGPATIQNPELTEKGIDFLLGDEGLSSILNTRTIRIDGTSIRQLAIIIAQSACAPQKDKETVISIIKSVPLNALKKWLTDVVDEALPSPEAAVRLIQTVLSVAHEIS